MFARLLVGLDGSAGADAALDAAIALGTRFRATIVLAAIADARLLDATLLGSGAGLWTEGLQVPADVGPLGEALAQRCGRLLADAATRVSDADLPLEEVRATGLVEEELLKLAGRAEALVVGRRGEMHQGHGTVGAVTAKVIRHASCPVVVAGEQPSVFERPLVGYDGGETSEAALALAARYAEACHLPLDVVHVGAHREGEAVAAKAQAFLAGTSARHQVRRLEGDIVPTLTAYATGSRADALLVGAHGGRRRHGWPLGSRAEAVLRTTPIPVIVVR
jgi:nucleotide-binding universal stress UspA family protein